MIADIHEILDFMAEPKPGNRIPGPLSLKLRADLTKQPPSKIVVLDLKGSRETAYIGTWSDTSEGPTYFDMEGVRVFVVEFPLTTDSNGFQEMRGHDIWLLADGRLAVFQFSREYKFGGPTFSSSWESEDRYEARLEWFITFDASDKRKGPVVTAVQSGESRTAVGV